MSKRFLIIDSSEILLQQMSFSCEVLGWEAVTISHPCDAVSVLESSIKSNKPFDAVIVDIALPDCDGPALLMRIRSISTYLPIVIATGVVNNVVNNAIQQTGGCVLVEKPVSFGQLIAAVDRVVFNNPQFCFNST